MNVPISPIPSLRRPFFIHWLSPVILSAFLVNSIGPMPAYGQTDELKLPLAGVMVRLSPPLDPPMLKGIKVYPDNPFRFDFILDRGENELSSDALKDESGKLIKYFLSSLTIPEKDLWVNLSPYEKERIIPNSFGLTQMGRDLLAQDYVLKQITASLIYPEDIIGKNFWKRVYEEAAKRYGSTDIPVNTFNKVWIVPDKAVVYENAKAGTAYVIESKLKVMLDQDYLSLEKSQTPTRGHLPEGHVSPSRLPTNEGLQLKATQVNNQSTSNLPAKEGLQLKAPQGNNAATSEDINSLGSQIIREIVIPQLTREVNENKNFTKLRQAYNSLILATWYKKKIKDSILSQVYTDKNRIAGITVDDPQEKEKIYQRYLQAFKKGVYNYIKEEVDPLTQQIIPRKYFSGGISGTNLSLNVFRTTSQKPDTAMLALRRAKVIQIVLRLPSTLKQLITGSNLKGKVKEVFGEDIDALRQLGFRDSELTQALSGDMSGQWRFGVPFDLTASEENTIRQEFINMINSRSQDPYKEIVLYAVGLGVEPKEALDVIKLFYKVLSDSGLNPQDWHLTFIGIDKSPDIVNNANDQLSAYRRASGLSEDNLYTAAVEANALSPDALQEIFKNQGRGKKADIVLNRHTHYGNLLNQLRHFTFDAIREHDHYRKQALNVFLQIKNIFTALTRPSCLYVTDEGENALIIPGAKMEGKSGGMYRVVEPTKNFSLHDLFKDLAMQAKNPSKVINVITGAEKGDTSVLLGMVADELQIRGMEGTVALIGLGNTPWPFLETAEIFPKAKVLGIDEEENLVSFQNKNLEAYPELLKNERVSIKRGDATDLSKTEGGRISIADQTVGFVYFQNVFDLYIQSPENILKMLREAIRVLKPGGYLYVDDGAGTLNRSKEWFKSDPEKLRIIKTIENELKDKMKDLNLADSVSWIYQKNDRAMINKPVKKTPNLTRAQAEKAIGSQLLDKIKRQYGNTAPLSVVVESTPDSVVIGIEDQGRKIFSAAFSDSQNWGPQSHGQTHVINEKTLTSYIKPPTEQNLLYLHSIQTNYTLSESGLGRQIVANLLKFYGENNGYTQMSLIPDTDNDQWIITSRDGQVIESHYNDDLDRMPIKPQPITSAVRTINNLKGVSISQKASKQYTAVTNAQNGGIDLTPAKMNLQTQTDSRFPGNDMGIKFNIDPVMLEELRNAPGFVALIINIQPLNSLGEFLGDKN
ncbi:MAG: class I SAM-dependent methyltransferase [Candidatus Omnitrophica bacterium]|nr:class I SAM-dependent methyltransferase [Candidatus Omnitrophota bacterium]